jgi:hypothetical protein
MSQMRNRWASTVAVVLLTVIPIAGQVPAYKAPRTTDGKPDLNGIWQSLNTANWDIEAHGARAGRPDLGAFGAVPAGLGVVEGGDLPYQPWAAARKKENAVNWMALDPEVKCYLPGVPRATYQPFPFQIIQTPKSILMSYEFSSAARTIPIRSPEPSPVDSWMGQSSGRWEGDTLVVDVIGFNDQTWFDRAGNFHSDALHIVERYTPTSPNTLNYEATIEDPKVFTRPWKMNMPLYRRVEKNMQVLEFKCVEFVEEMMYGPLLKKTSK